MGKGFPLFPKYKKNNLIETGLIRISSEHIQGQNETHTGWDDLRN